ncbi:hypothetical protein RHGRI_030839 [Rhododendron griersonianum]|uniref:Uncharacterized protein n=1 Tax=Rhododendron griersonianum TaxID=479676 RepID=A0AAV6I865_9ERIC|nr:hypothetical protein RHGRI_030839 [Rhododendron griersonianum]
MESFPISPLVHPSLLVSQSPMDSAWLESPMANIGVAQTSFVDKHVVKRRKTSHVDRGSSVGDGELTQLGDDLLHVGGHPQG